MKKIIITIFIAFTATVASAANYNSLRPLNQIVYPYPQAVVAPEVTQVIIPTTPVQEVQQPIRSNNSEALSNELDTAYEKTNSLIRKSQTDDATINALRQEIMRLNSQISSFKPTICPKVEAPKEIKQPVIVEKPITIIEDKIVKVEEVQPIKKVGVLERINNWIQNIIHGKSN